MPKQLSVEQQNQIARQEIERTAARFKSPPAWLDSLLVAQGLKSDAGVLVRLKEIPEQGGGRWLQGVWLAENLSFWAFSAIAIGELGELMSVEEFNDVTASMPITQHIRGTGRSFGWLACEVLRVERGV